MARKTSCIDGAWPRISGAASSARLHRFGAPLRSIARRTSSTAWSTSNGLGRYSKAPPWKAATARIEIGIGGHDDHRQRGNASLTSCSSSRPDSPGMRMSDTSTCGTWPRRVRQRLAGRAKLLAGNSSRPSAFSSTQRMERSSSMIQTGFMVFFSHLVITVRCMTSTESLAPAADARSGAPGPLAHFDGAVMLLDETLGDGQPEPAAPFASRTPADRRCLSRIFRECRAVVDHLQFECQAVALLRQRDLAQRAGAQTISPWPCIACAALRAMFRMAWISCSRSPVSPAGWCRSRGAHATPGNSAWIRRARARGSRGY
jgi:hypothetical protein